MIDRPVTHQQPDLLVLTANALESSRIPRATRAWLRQEGIPVVVYSSQGEPCSGAPRAIMRCIGC